MSEIQTPYQRLCAEGAPFELTEEEVFKSLNKEICDLCGDKSIVADSGIKDRKACHEAEIAGLMEALKEHKKSKKSLARLTGHQALII